MEYHYRYRHPSPLVKFSSVPAKESTRQVVYLYASEDAAAGAMQPLVAALKAAGYADCFADWREGRACLAIRGVKDAETLRSWLAQRGELRGAPVDVQSIPNEDDRISSSYIKQNSSRLSAISGLARTGFTTIPYILQRDYGVLLGYATIIPHAAILSYYNAGEGESADELMNAARKDLARQDILMPQTSTPLSWWRSAERLVAQNPVQAAFAVGLPFCVNAVRSGLNAQTRNPWLVYTGLASLAGTSAIVFVPENRRSKEQQEKPVAQEISEFFLTIPNALVYSITHPWDAPGMLWEHIRESPKRFNAEILNGPGIFLSVMNGLHHKRKLDSIWPNENPAKIAELKHNISRLEQAGSAIRATDAKHLGKLKQNVTLLTRQMELSHSSARHMIPASFYAAASIGLLNSLLYLVGTKNRFSQQMDMTKFDQLYTQAAQELLALPVAQRERAVGALSEFLANHEEVQDGQISHETLMEEITSRMEKLPRSPWAVPEASLVRRQASGIRRN